MTRMSKEFSLVLLGAGLLTAMRLGLSQYARFGGRSTRSEYWWWIAVVYTLGSGTIAVGVAARELGVAWAEDAYTVAPLTADAANVALFLDALAPDVMPVDGHRADRAITHAAGLLRQAGFERGRILLLAADANVQSRAIAAATAGCSSLAPPTLPAVASVEGVVVVRAS